MSAFEFFFSFYGLLLGFSVAELVGGFARLIHRRQPVRFGILTPMLAVFVAVDIATFWNQAWVAYRNAPFNFSLLILGLVVASTFYVAATAVFPREVQAGESLDDHFWRNRRVVLLCTLAANLISAAAFFGLAALGGEFGRLQLSFVFWAGFTLFTTGTLLAALAPNRRVTVAALVLLLLYQGFIIGRATVALVDGGGWPMSRSAPPSPVAPPSAP